MDIQPSSSLSDGFSGTSHPGRPQHHSSTSGFCHCRRNAFHARIRAFFGHAQRSRYASPAGSRDAGINVALGTDNVTNNNSYDMFKEMSLTGKLMALAPSRRCRHTHALYSGNGYHRRSPGDRQRK